MMLFALFVLNIVFVGALWRMDVHHNLDKYGQSETRGIFKMKAETAYRVSYYVLILTLLIIDLLFIVKFFLKLIYPYMFSHVYSFSLRREKVRMRVI